MALRYFPNDLLQLHGELSDITKGLPISAGSPFRIAHQYLENWGIKVTKDNRQIIEDLAESVNRMEWKCGGNELDMAIHRAVAKAGLSKNNIDLNTMLGSMGAQILSSMDDGKRIFRVLDIGSGSGNTSEAVLDGLPVQVGDLAAMDFASTRLDLSLLDPSMIRLHEASDLIDKNNLIPRKCEYICSSILDYIPKLQNGSIDMIITSAVFHHVTFLRQLLDQLREKLSEDGVIIIGDWHHTFCAHPGYTVQLLKNIEAEPDRIRAFEKLFDIRKGDLERFESELSVTQVKDNRAALLYLTALGEEMNSVKNAHFFFLEALESFSDRKKKIEDAHFETSMFDLKQKHKGFVKLASNIKRAYPDSDIANVIAAAKIPRSIKRMKIK